MSWPLFSRKDKPRASSNFDYQLVKKTQSNAIPTLAQTKYLFHFLSKREKLIFSICLSVAAVCTLALIGLFLSDQLVLVPKAGGEYSEALIGQPKYLNPIYASASDVDADISSLIYSGLFRYDSAGNLATDLAESFTVSTDTKSYDIKLRQNIRFGDGETLTANDVMYTIDLIQNPKAASPLLPSFQGVSLERINDYEVRFTLKAAFAPFLSALTVGILPEHLWNNSSPESLQLSKNNLQPIGTGPWQFSRLVKDSTGRIDSLTLTPNNEYYGDKPWFRTIRFKFFDEYGGALEALRSQSIDGLSFLPRMDNPRLNNKFINFYKLQLPEYTALFFNSAYQPTLKNDDTRLALAKTINKNLLVKNALNDQGSPVDTPFLSGSLGDNKGMKQIETNIDEANTLLDKNWTRIPPEEYFNLRRDAMRKDLQKTTSSTISDNDDALIGNAIRAEMDPAQLFYRKDKSGNILQLTITTADTEEYSQVAEQIASRWELVGIKTSVEKVAAGRLARE
ncbi:MAG: ABC transporter substrate-binding protein [Patescibacteria group bacterium]